jgi:hypothetical protein
MTGSPTVTIAGGTATFSLAQTGNIGIGDKVTYSTSSIAFISGKVSTSQWTLVTATGATPANVTSVSVTSIKRAFTSLESAITGFTGASYLNNTSLVAANVIVNLPCYYDSGPDTTSVVIPSSTITGAANYLNIFTPNNTSTQANVSQRDNGTWTATGAYNLVVTNGGYSIKILASYVNVTGLEVDSIQTSTSTQQYPYAIATVLPAGSTSSTSDIVIDSNLVRFQAANTSLINPSVSGISFNNTSSTTGIALNNIVWNDGVATGTAYGILTNGGVFSVYNNTVYGMTRGYYTQTSAAGSLTTYKNDIAQDGTVGGYGGSGTVSASSTNNLSDHNDTPGSNGENAKTVAFVSTSTDDFLLVGYDAAARGNGVNLTNDPIYPFTWDIVGTTRPSSGAWDIGAAEYEVFYTTPPSLALVYPGAGATVSSTVTLVASSTNSIAIQFQIDDTNLGSIITTTSGPTLYSAAWNTNSSVNGTHTITAVAYNASYTTSTVSESVTVANTIAATPTFASTGDTYASAVAVVVSCATPSSTIYYTVTVGSTGSTPTPASTEYAQPVGVSQTSVIGALCTAPGYTNSSIAWTTISVAPVPTYSVPQGIYNTPQTVALSCTAPSSTIYYLVNSPNSPTVSSNVYSSPLTISTSSLVASICSTPGYYSSPPVGSTYIIAPTPTSTPTISFTVNQSSSESVVPSDFLGFSFNSTYVASNWFSATDTSLGNILSNLGPGVLRFGADNVEYTYWSRSATATFPGAEAVIDPADVNQLFSFAQNVGYKVLYGLNLGADNPSMAADQASYVSSVAGSGLLGYEIGNEPNDYASNGVRSPSYDEADYEGEFNSYLLAIDASDAGAPISGPVTSGGTWFNTFIQDEHSNIASANQHYYQSAVETPAFLTSPPSTSTFQTAASVAQQYDLPIVMGETNSEFSGLNQGDISNTFVNALWGLDYMFTLAQEGYSNVDLYGGLSSCTYYSPLCEVNNIATPQPLYYAMLAFHAAAGSGGTVVPVNFSTSQNVTSYAILRNDGDLSVTIINKDPSVPITAQISPGGIYTFGASVERLSAPSLLATSTVTFGGSFVNASGIWQASSTETAIASSSFYDVSVPAASAAIVVFNNTALLATPPTLGTPSASSVTTSTATLNGTISSINNASATIEGFNYGTSTAYGLIASSTGSFGTGSFSESVSTLDPDTTYHVEAFATNSAGTGTSTDATFTTASAGLPTATNVTVTGTTTIGDTLTGSYTFSDPNGNPQTSSTYQWLGSPSSNGSYSAITGATGTTCVTTSTDIGQYLEFQVTPVSLSGTGSRAVSGPTSQIQSSGPPTASSVNITGTSTEGDTLSGHFTYSQTNGVPHGVSTFKWLESSSAGGTYTAIASATANIYALAPSDVGNYLEFQVTPVATYPPTTGTPVTSADVGPIAPSSLPVASALGITGTTTVGDTLTGSYSYSDSGANPQASSTFQWFEASSVNGSYTTISGATLETYTLASTDIGKYLKFQVTPVSTVATGSPVMSNPTGEIESSGVPIATSVTITGTPSFGQLLTGSYIYHQTDSVPEASSTYAWLEAASQNGTYSAIPGATNLTYTVAAGDEGKYIEFQVTPVASYPPTTGSSATSTSVAVSDTNIPVVTMTAPSANTTVAGTVTVSASATAINPATIFSLQLYLDGSTLGPLLTTPSSTNIYSYSWDTTGASNGTHTLSALATDDYSNVGTSTPITVTVSNPVVNGGGGGGGGGYVLPVTTTSTTTASTSITSLPTTTAGLQALLASLETELDTLLQQAAAQGITIPGVASSSPFNFTRNLMIGSKGSDVEALQHYLNTHGFPVNATPTYAGSLGYETQYFGKATQTALAEFQKSVGISPAVGFFGPITRAWVSAHDPGLL